MGEEPARSDPESFLQPFDQLGNLRHEGPPVGNEVFEHVPGARRLLVGGDRGVEHAIARNRRPLVSARAIGNAQRVVDLDDLTAAQLGPGEPVRLPDEVALLLVLDQPTGLLEGDSLRWRGGLPSGG